MDQEIFVLKYFMCQIFVGFNFRGSDHQRKIFYILITSHVKEFCAIYFVVWGKNEIFQHRKFPDLWYICQWMLLESRHKQHFALSANFSGTRTLWLWPSCSQCLISGSTHTHAHTHTHTHIQGGIQRSSLGGGAGCLGQGQDGEGEGCGWATGTRAGAKGSQG